VHCARSYGNAGVSIVAAISGVADVDPVTISIAAAAIAGTAAAALCRVCAGLSYHRYIHEPSLTPAFSIHLGQLCELALQSAYFCGKSRELKTATPVASIRRSTMSHTTSIETSSPRSEPLSWPLVVLRRIGRRVSLARTRRQLRALDDRMLADIGIARSDINGNFWEK
jgi:uncharacterized protein YjiS (DUF1127 family)